MALDKIKPSVLKLAEKFETALTINGDKAELDKKAFNEAYSETLPEGLNIDLVKATQNHNLDVADALTLVLGRKAGPHMKDNKDVNVLSVTAPLALDRVAVEYHREKSYRNPSNGETFTKKGVTKVQYLSGIGGKRDSLKQVQDYLAAEAESLFNN